MSPPYKDFHGNDTVGEAGTQPVVPAPARRVVAPYGEGAIVYLYQSPIKMCNAHFNCDTVIGTRRIFAMLSLSSRKCNAGTALKTD